MENTRSALPVGFIVLLGLFIALERPIAAAPARLPREPRRTIGVKVLADSALRKNEIWKVNIFIAMRDVSQTLAAVSGVTLEIKAYDYWTPDPIAVEASGIRRRKTVAEVLFLMNSHIREAPREGSEIIIGLIPEGPEGPGIPGIADYLMGTVVIKNLKSKGGIPFVLLHEICHIFGAVDLRTEGSVMSLRNPTFWLDDFTKSIIRINRARTFRVGGCPLSEGRILDAIELYRNRRALGLGEDELGICLSILPRLARALEH
jgi:hypothetical protein